ncbi:MAG: PTS galactitol transporter subunit IIA, partial [Hafnia sp.]
LLRRLFSELQNPNTIEALLNAPDAELAMLFREKILETEPCAQA